MQARVDEELGEGVLAIFNGIKFKLNDLVERCHCWYWVGGSWEQDGAIERIL